MRIESIEIKNFRQYRDEKFTFPKKSGHKDIHIIIGENGEGKTNLLNALTWCLYDEELHLGDKNTAIRRINSQYVEELRKSNKKYGEVSVTVRMSLEETNSTMDFMRTATFSITDSDAVETKSNIIAVRTGGPRGAEFIENKDDVQMWVSRYVPREINEYIFFDGELMDQYFKDSQRKNIESGIKDLTQASVVEKAIRNIEIYERQEISPMLAKFGDSQVRIAQENLGTALKKYQDQQTKVEIIKDNIRNLEAKRDELNDKIKGHDGLKGKMNQLESVDRQITSLTEQERRVNEQMIEFVQEYYVYFALYPALKKFYDYIKKQEKAGNLPPKVDRKLVEAIRDSKVCSICGNHLDTEHLQHVLSILQKLEVSSATSAELNKASMAIRSIFDQMKRYNSKKNQLLTDAMRIKNDLTDAERERSELEAFLRTIPNTEEISHAIDNRATCQGQLDNENQRLGREQHYVEQYKREAESAQDELDRAVKNNKAMEIYGRQMDFCNKSLKILHSTKDEILAECRQEMQKETFDIFSRLIWKKDAFSRVNILENYSFQLLDSYGEQTLGSCSAAERALLALSFTIALQKTSGHDSLLYIDTPLGRVGERNRVNFMQVLLDVADSKQVILSFTPTEYDENVRAQLNQKYSSYCELSFENGTTKIKK